MHIRSYIDPFLLTPKTDEVALLLLHLLELGRGGHCDVARQHLRGGGGRLRVGRLERGQQRRPLGQGGWACCCCGGGGGCVRGARGACGAALLRRGDGGGDDGGNPVGAGAAAAAAAGLRPAVLPARVGAVGVGVGTWWHGQSRGREEAR